MAKRTRRHSNTKGTRQIKRGKTVTQVKAIAKRLGVPYGDARRPVFEVWATLHPEAVQDGTHGICLWGTQADARLGQESDEKIALVRVEVLEVLD